MKVFANNKPNVLDEDLHGRFLYHFNIEEIEVEDEEGNLRTEYQYEEVELYAPLNADEITRRVIKHLWSNDHEQKLINEYNAVKLGVIEDEGATQAYIDFLTDRHAIKKQVDSDCETLGIK